MFVRKKALKRYNDLNHMNEISKVQDQVHYLTLKKTCCDAVRWQKYIDIFIKINRCSIFGKLKYMAKVNFV